jgi:hypothetical protein
MPRPLVLYTYLPAAVSKPFHLSKKKCAHSNVAVVPVLADLQVFCSYDPGHRPGPGVRIRDAVTPCTRSSRSYRARFMSHHAPLLRGAKKSERTRAPCKAKALTARRVGGRCEKECDGGVGRLSLCCARARAAVAPSALKTESSSCSSNFCA